MKIIGKTAKGYLVEADPTELALCAGYSSFYAASVRGSGFTRDHNGRELVALGAQIKVDATFRYLEKLRENEAKCKSSAAFLRGMADMIDAAMPTTIIPPGEEETQ